MSNTLNSIIGQFAELEKRLNGSKTLPIHKLRTEALQGLKEIGLPGNKHEEYKFTRLTSLLEKNLDLDQANASSNISETQIAQSIYQNLDGSALVFINDELSEEFSQLHAEHKDILIQDLKKASKDQPEGFNHYFSDNKTFNSDGFLAWNTALTEKGVHIRVEANKTYEKPIALYFISDAQSQQVINSPRVLIELGENSEATFIEKFVTIGEHFSFNNSVVEVIVDKATRGKYIKIQDDSEKAIQMNSTQVYQPENSTFSVFTFTFSGKMVRNNLNIVVDGQGSEANMYGLYLTKGDTHVDNHTSVDHRQPHSESNELYKGIMDENSRGVFNGKIYVRQAAQKTNAFQSNNNILLSDDATVNTKPQLEIWADDVKCSHGCTTGQLDEEQIFYLRSRGVEKNMAQSILLQAFAKDVLDKVPTTEIREQLETIITDRLG